MNASVWWKEWGEVVGKLIALIGSFASMGGLLIAFLPPRSEMPLWVEVSLLIAAFFLVVLIGLEFRTRRLLRVYSNSDVNGIRHYMHAWIEHGDTVAIWSRDLTWAQNPETRKLLEEKAKRSELILCLPENNEFTTELQKAGANVCAYGSDTLATPASRFTIAFFGKSGARLAVGRPEGNFHVIEEFGEGGHPAFALAEDLVAFARAIGKNR